MLRFSPLLGLLLLLAAVGCKDSDREQMRKVGGKSVEHLEELVGGPNGTLLSGLDAFRGAIDHRTADSRVVTRLRWDRDLTGSLVSARPVKPGVVALEGTVPSAEARQRAVSLARATTGVEEVVDSLKVVAPPPAKK